MAKTRKDKGITKPRKAEDDIIYNKIEFGALGAEEQRRLVINLANKLNRRMQRMEKANLETVPGYEAYEKAIKAIEGKEGKRFSKSTKGKTEAQLWKAYSKMLRASETRTGSYTRAKAYVSSIGRTSSGEQLFTFEEYRQATPQQQRQFWRNFEQYREYLQKHEKYEAGSGGLTSLAIYEEYGQLNPQDVFARTAGGSGGFSGIKQTAFPKILKLQEALVTENLEAAFPDESELETSGGLK